MEEYLDCLPVLLYLVSDIVAEYSDSFFVPVEGFDVIRSKKNSDSDPSHFDVDPDPDPGIHIWEKWIRKKIEKAFLI